jgi:hypothetical protein
LTTHFKNIILSVKREVVLHKGIIIITGLALVVLAIFVYRSLRNPVNLEWGYEILELFESNTSQMKSGRFDYPLPDYARCQDELDYIGDLAGFLAEEYPDCQKLVEKTEARYQDFGGDSADSMFRRAAVLWLKRKDADFVHRTSHQIRTPFRLGGKLNVVPTDPDQKLALLAEKNNMIKSVAAGSKLLRQVLSNAENFLEYCPDNVDSVKNVLGYFTGVGWGED